MERIIITKDKTKITMEVGDGYISNGDVVKVTINYEFLCDGTEAEKDSLEDYIYLLDKIHSYMKSGEYVVEKQELDAPESL